MLSAVPIQPACLGFSGLSERETRDSLAWFWLIRYLLNETLGSRADGCLGVAVDVRTAEVSTEFASSHQQSCRAYDNRGCRMLVPCYAHTRKGDSHSQAVFANGPGVAHRLSSVLQTSGDVCLLNEKSPVAFGVQP